MSLRRVGALSESTADAARLLKQAETAIALLDRVRPVNLGSELARLSQAAEQGTRLAPAFSYAPAARLGEVRRQLAALAPALASGDVEQGLLFARAEELELEAQLAEHVDTVEFARLAARRFPLPDARDAGETLARRFLTTPGPSGPSEGELHDAADRHDPDSLWSQVARRLDAERWPVRIEIVVGLVSLAAVAEGAVRIRAGAKLTASSARRIALHEVEGHVRPRQAGQDLGGVFLAGSRGASEDEEGHAIWLEERAGLLEPARRAELARRYWAACSVRAGATFWDTVEVLGQRGATLRAAIELAARAHRGGGLGRELIYLSGYARVASAFAQRPALRLVLMSGRVGIEAAERLLASRSVELDDDGDVI